MKLQSPKWEVSQNPAKTESPAMILLRGSEADKFDPEQWKHIFNPAANAMRIVDIRYRTVHVNDAFCRMVGVTKEEAVGRHCYDCFPGEACGTATCPLEHAITGENSVEFESAKERPDGFKQTFIISATAIRDHNEAPMGILESFVDITEVKMSQQILKSANEELRVQLESKNTALNEVLSQIEVQKQLSGTQLQSNVNRIVLPLLQIVKEKLSVDDEHLIGLLENALRNLMEPAIGKLEKVHTHLSPRELEICNMIRQGFSSKQIASILNVSVHTVNNQRFSIRRKLAIDGDRTNLENYLKSL